jgi:phosphatidylglycerophosphate synthase
MTSFREADRRLGLTARVEKRLLWWLAGRLPGWATSDHLTLLGFVAMAGAGAAYTFSRLHPAALHVASLCLFVNWFGDSLDGTLARYRRCERPRYGFYLDHLVDMIGALLLLAGLALSGLMSPAVAVALLVAYYLLSINVYLATYTLGVFEIGYAGLGGTELRLLLVTLNLLALRSPRLSVLGFEPLLFDLAGALAVLGLLAALLFSAARNLRTLAMQERQ